MLINTRPAASLHGRIQPEIPSHQQMRRFHHHTKRGSSLADPPGTLSGGELSLSSAALSDLPRILLSSGVTGIYLIVEPPARYPDTIPRCAEHALYLPGMSSCGNWVGVSNLLHHSIIIIVTFYLAQTLPVPFYPELSCPKLSMGPVESLSDLIFSDIRAMVIRWAFCRVCSQFLCSLYLLKIVFRVRNS